MIVTRSVKASGNTVCGVPPAAAPQTNVLNQQRWTTRQELRLAIVVSIERKYHRQRAQDTLGGLTPIEFEAKITELLTLAA